MKDGDIVFDILQRVTEELGDKVLTKEIAAKIDQTVRRDWGGDRPYIAKTITGAKRMSPKKMKKLVDEKGIKEAMKTTGLKRRTIYRWIKTKPAE